MDCMDYNLVALERTVAYMHLDKAIVHHLNQENIVETTILSCYINIPGTVGGGWPPVGGAAGWAYGYGGALLGGYCEAAFGGYDEEAFDGCVGAAKNY